MRACVRTCVRACVRACARASACVHVSVRPSGPVGRSVHPLVCPSVRPYIRPSVRSSVHWQEAFVAALESRLALPCVLASVGPTFAAKWERVARGVETAESEWLQVADASASAGTDVGADDEVRKLRLQLEQLTAENAILRTRFEQ